MPAPTSITVSQDNSDIVRVNSSNTDTSLKTVYVYLTDGAGVTIEAGNASGAAVNTDIDIVCNWSLFEPGLYYLEVIADPTGTPITLVPNKDTGWPYYLIIDDTRKIA